LIEVYVDEEIIAIFRLYLKKVFAVSDFAAKHFHIFKLVH